MVRATRGLFAVALGAAVTVLVGVWGVPPAAAGETPGVLRFAHLSPDTPAVDIALARLPAQDGPPLTDPGPDVADDLGYGDVSEFAAVPPGSYAVSLRAAGSPRSTPPELTARVEVPAGGARTVALTGLFADLSLRTLSDDLTAPPAGAARVRVLAAASGTPSVDMNRTGGPALATDLPFGDAGSPVDVPAGPTTITVDGAPPLPVSLPAGSIHTLLVLDAPGGGLTVRMVEDAAGPAVTPVGAVEAGGGGAAALRLPLLVAGAGAALAAASRRGRVLAVVAAAVVSAAPSTSHSAAPGHRTVTLSAASPAPAEAPVRLRVPTAGIDTPLTGIDLDAAGALVPPSDDAVAGWYRSGPAPGEVGPAVLTGHVDSVAGPAVFFRLRDVAAGDPVTVTRTDGTTMRFTVTRVARFPKGAFPTGEVYAPTPRAELRLITCGGVFDRAAHSYLDNVVVYAQLS
jgi:hypothetical protein